MDVICELTRLSKCCEDKSAIVVSETPFRKSKTGKARDFKFGVRIDPGKSHLTNDKVPLKGAWSGSRIEFLNFKPPSVNLEQVKLETSNSVHG